MYRRREGCVHADVLSLNLIILFELRVLWEPEPLFSVAYSLSECACSREKQERSRVVRTLHMFSVLWSLGEYACSREKREHSRLVQTPPMFSVLWSLYSYACRG